MIEILESLLGGIFFFLIPGISWCFLIFRKERLDVLEFLCLSIALSISLSTLSVFFLNALIGLKITRINVVIVVSALTVIPVIIRLLEQKITYDFEQRRED
ncbi:MAG: hypothetical protein O8C63_08215 [Candidatus Methanoperedens sp.]|nr:hypothetical protein [Candidatus Methanoperedens sp.]